MGGLLGKPVNPTLQELETTSSSNINGGQNKPYQNHSIMSARTVDWVNKHPNSQHQVNSNSIHQKKAAVNPTGEEFRRASFYVSDRNLQRRNQNVQPSAVKQPHARELFYKYRNSQSQLDHSSNQPAEAAVNSTADDSHRLTSPTRSSDNSEVEAILVNTTSVEDSLKAADQTHVPTSGLPILSVKQKFIEMMRKHQVLIVMGDTGSGKSTQLTKYLDEAGFGICGKIVCTQPRRMAAKSLARRVAFEMKTKLGDQVGYRVRFENKAAINTSITYVTDGILLQELECEPLLHAYAVVMLDEVHERSINTDILLGLLKRTMRKRPHLKIIIASATMDTAKFSTYFDNAPVLHIPGKPFPVSVEYAMGDPFWDELVFKCADKVVKIHREEPDGDILIFLSGEEEIERCCDILRENGAKLWVLPCYAALPLEEQTKVFEPTPDNYERKVVVATNIAETSITIDGIVYVIDSGIVKRSEYDPQRRMTSLVLNYITQSQAIQRSGRAGRTRPGKAFRLYSRNRFEHMMKDALPEIQRNNLEFTILTLAAHGIEDVDKFDYLDPPPPDTVRSSIRSLQDLGALDSNGQLTLIGRQISKFPLDPKLSKILILSWELNCSEDVLSIVSVLSAQSAGGKIFRRPRKHQREADDAKREFWVPEGDHQTLLNVYQSWKKANCSWNWCKENFINYFTLEEAVAIRSQLEGILSSHCAKKKGSPCSDPNTVQKCIASGYFSQIARKEAKGFGYKTYCNAVCGSSDLAFIHPSSVLFKSTPRWIIYDDMIKTKNNRAFLVNAMVVDPVWIKEFAPKFYVHLAFVFPELIDYGYDY